MSFIAINSENIKLPLKKFLQDCVVDFPHLSIDISINRVISKSLPVKINKNHLNLKFYTVSLNAQKNIKLSTFERKI